MISKIKASNVKTMKGCSVSANVRSQLFWSSCISCGPRRRDSDHKMTKASHSAGQEADDRTHNLVRKCATQRCCLCWPLESIQMSGTSAQVWPFTPGIFSLVYSQLVSEPHKCVVSSCLRCSQTKILAASYDNYCIRLVLWCCQVAEWVEEWLQHAFTHVVKTQSAAIFFNESVSVSHWNTNSCTAHSAGQPVFGLVTRVPSIF